MKQISNDFVSYSKTHSLRVFAPLGIMACSVLGALNVQAASSTISLSVSSGAEIFAIAPNSSTGTFAKSSDIIASVSTDHFSGYTLTVSGADDGQNLVGERTGATIPSISRGEEANESAFRDGSRDNYNKWGFLPGRYCSGDMATGCEDNVIYREAPINSTPTKIDITNSATEIPATYTLAIGARVNNEVEKDVYSTTFTLAATVNQISYNISYVDPTNNMPEQTSGNTTGQTAKLSGKIPFKSGYAFKGWCTDIPVNGSCPAEKTYQANSDFPLSQTESNSRNIYAIWEPIDCEVNLCMQDVDKWDKDSMTTDVAVEAIDARDGKRYWVTKLQDGNIWMTQNLDFNIPTAPLTSNDTDLTVFDESDTGIYGASKGYSKNGSVISWTPLNGTLDATERALSYAAPIAGWGSDDLEPQSVDIGLWYQDGSDDELAECNSYWPQDKCRGRFSRTPFVSNGTHGELGNYYNYPATIATNNATALSWGGTDPQNSICPKGWRMPTIRNSNDFYGLATIYNGGTAAGIGDAGLFASPLYFVRAGLASEGGFYSLGQRGIYLSSSNDTNRNVRELVFSANDISSDNGDSLTSARSVRCVAR